MGNQIINFDSNVKTNNISSDQIYIDIDINAVNASNKIGNYIQYEYFLKEASDFAEDQNDKIKQVVLNTDKENANSVNAKIMFLANDTITCDKAIKRLKRKAKYKISNLINIQAIQNSIRNIFTWVPGERILNPEFGSKLPMLLYEGITKNTEELIIAEIRHCIQTWDPRVKIQHLLNVSTTNETEQNIIHLEIIYSVPSLTDDQLYNYPFIQQITVV